MREVKKRTMNNAKKKTARKSWMKRPTKKNSGGSTVATEPNIARR
jgi:hypothetical protein